MKKNFTTTSKNTSPYDVTKLGERNARHFQIITGDNREIYYVES